MKTFDELQTLWQSQAAAPLPAGHNVQRQAQATQKALRQKHLRQMGILIVTAIALLAIDQINRQRIEVSNLGLVILLVCALGFAAARWFLIWQLDRIDWTGPARHKLQQWATYRRRSQWLLRQGQVIYGVLLAIGVFAYLWPVAQLLPWWITASVGLAFLVWAGIYTFYLQRKAANQEDLTLKAIMDQFPAG